MAEFKKPENGLFPDEDACATTISSCCWGMLVDFDTKCLTFAFDEASRNIDGQFSIKELSSCIPRIMANVRTLRLQMQGETKNYTSMKFGLDDADLVSLLAKSGLGDI